ncbi:hypothetical protein HMPREF1585_00122 [Gardnerella vaginalis JCP8481B]|nr:hypothetical protein HMPREF1585_00122 [Gardnerella vaginalis JCP8481B]
MLSSIRTKVRLLRSHNLSALTHKICIESTFATYFLLRYVDLFYYVM